MMPVPHAGLWLAEEPLILASRSESRRAVLAAAALAVEVLPADVDERAIEADAADKSPGAVARLLANAKALAISTRRPGRLVLGADQEMARSSRSSSLVAALPRAPSTRCSWSGDQACSPLRSQAPICASGSRLIFSNRRRVI